MDSYCVSVTADKNDNRQIHKLYYCNDFPFKDDRKDFIEQSDEKAIVKAKQLFGNICRCTICMPEE